MVAIQTNSSISSGVMTRSSYTTAGTLKGKAVYDNKSTNLKTGIEFVQFSSQIKTGTRLNITDQNALIRFDRLSQEEKAGRVYDGTPVSDLSVDDAKSLVGPGGYFGVDKTSRRIADFVIKGAGDDIEKLRAGREGVLKGFDEAEKAWGGKLPDISYDTLAKSLEAIDDRIEELGGSIVDITA